VQRRGLHAAVPKVARASDGSSDVLPRDDRRVVTVTKKARVRPKRTFNVSVACSVSKPSNTSISPLVQKKSELL